MVINHLLTGMILQVYTPQKTDGLEPENAPSKKKGGTFTKQQFLGFQLLVFSFFFPIQKTYSDYWKKDPLNEEDVWTMLNMVICQQSLC